MQTWDDNDKYKSSKGVKALKQQQNIIQNDGLDDDILVDKYKHDKGVQVI